MAFDVKDRTKFAARDCVSQCAHRRPEAPVMSDSKYHASLAAGLEHPRCFGAAQRMRRRQQDRVDAAIGEDGVQIASQLKMMLGAKVLRAFEVGLYGTHDLQPLVAERGLDETAAPAAEADDRCADHREPSDAMGRRRIASIGGTFASIRRTDNGPHIRPSPMIATGL